MEKTYCTQTATAYAHGTHATRCAVVYITSLLTGLLIDGHKLALELWPKHLRALLTQLPFTRHSPFLGQDSRYVLGTF